MLTLVVCSAAAVEPVAFLREDPWAEAAAPLLLLTPDHVAMSVHQDGSELFILDALGQQKRPSLA